MIMRHGQKDTARKIIFDTSHALYNTTRKANPRPELKQRDPRFVPGSGAAAEGGSAAAPAAQSRR